ncbi:MAG: hypothetical protein ACTXOO_00860 [Sodalis sp. (in: enterobacteria)]
MKSVLGIANIVNTLLTKKYLAKILYRQAIIAMTLNRLSLHNGTLQMF